MLERILHNLGWARTPSTQPGESLLRDGRARTPASPYPARVSPVPLPANDAAGIRALPRVLTGRIGILKYVATALIAVFAIGEVGAVSTAPINPAFKEWQRRKSDASVSEKKPGEANARGPRLLSANSGVEERRLLGHVPSSVDYSYLKNINYQQVAQAATVTFPARFDLRDEGMLTSMKNQNPWGTCWAHATIGSLESGVLMGGGASLDLSEWHLANTHGFDYSTKNGDGGNGDMAIAYLTRWSGPIDESQDPYPSVYRDSPVGTPVGHVQNVKILTPMSTAFDTDEIKKTLMEHGSIYAGYLHLWAAESLDEKSYYWNGDTSMYQSERDGGGHAVQIVGWDDNYSKSHFRQSPPGNGAFICKNSWGTSYGENGYFYVSYYDAMFGADELYSFFELQDTKNYDGIYQYDPLGHVNNCGGTSPCWGANVFRCGKDNEEIAAVGFYSLVKNTKYVIEIYTDCSESKPTSGNRQVSQSGTCDFVGYVTVPLSSSVQIKNGRLFSVVIKLTTPGYSYPLAYEAYFSFKQNGKTYWTPTSEATASAGQSFMSQNGTSWMDFTTAIHPTANFCCKAYTKSASAPAKTLASVAITGVNSLQSGKTAQFTCKAKYSDNSDADVTSNASTCWSIASGSAYASVSSTGLVTAKSVTQQQTVKVHADYTEGGVTKSDDWSFYVTVLPPEPPTDLIASQGTDAACVRVTWTASAGASSYAVYRGTTVSSSNAQYLQEVTVAKFNDTEAESGVNYYYFVKAKNASGTSSFSAGALGWRALSAPANVVASDGTSLAQVDVTWSEVKGAKYYRVYRADEMDGAPTALGSWQTGTAYADTTAVPGRVYFYTVKAAIDSRGNRASAESIFDDGFVGVPVTLDAIAINGAASIPSGGSAAYTCTATMTDMNTKNVSPTWSVTAGSSYVTRSGATLTAKTVTANQSVTLQASYTEGGVTRTTTKPITITATKPPAPSSVTLTSATPEAVTIGWSSVAGALGYSVWRGTTTADAKKIADVGTATEYADRDGSPGVSLKYWVKASNAAGESDFSTMSVTATRALAAPTGVAASDGQYGDMTQVSWKPVVGATHYRVARASSATGTKTELGSWQTGTSYEDMQGVPGTHYWYFVRAATSSSGTNASAYSAGVEGWSVVVADLSSLAISGVTKLAAGASAVLSCTATYSDGSKKTVKPSWTVSPTTAATIDADGKLTAKQVSSDVTVTVTALYADASPRSATHRVTVVAPIVTTAEVKNVQPKTRWPFSSLLDVDFELVTQPAGTRALVTLSGHDGDKNVAMAARTLTGDGANGPVAAGRRRLTWNVAADYPDFHAKAFTVEMSAVPMAANMPSNVTASAGTSTAGVNIGWAAVDDATGYEVWRNTSSVTNGAQRIQTTSAVAYTDTAAAAGTTYWYWVKSITPDGTSDFGPSVSGWRAYADITVTFNANGGSVNPASKPYSPTKTYGSLPTPLRTGYDFNGWYTASSGGTQVTTASTVPTANTTLWAHWTAHTYTIRFNANGGSGSMGDLAMTYDVAKNLTANAFAKSGFNFQGWATSAGGSVAYTDGCSVKNLTANNGVTVTLYAVWAAQVASLAEAVDNPALTITTGGGANWVVDTTTGYTGGVSAKSGAIGNGQNTWLQTTATGPGSFSFRWKVSSEAYYDTFVWTLDGAEQAEISGEKGWTQVTTELAAGTHTIRWTYTKDESGGAGGDCGWVDTVVTPLALPTNVSAGDGAATANVKITWTASAGATGYTIWRATANDTSKATQIATAAASPYTDATCSPGTTYWYWVRATDGTRTSAFGAPDTGYRALAAPTGVAAGDNTLACGVRITWDAVEGADGYAIYRGTSTASDAATQVGTSMGPAYVDSGVASGATYYYFVKANHASGTSSAFSAYDKGSRKAGTPLYVVVDLSGGTSAGNYPISELSSVPSGGWAVEYKTNKLVLRRIANGSFTMGGRSTDCPGASDSGLHNVTISKPFYMGVFEVTQKQYELVMGSKPSSYKGDARPVECVSYNTIRGSSQGAQWPSANTVDSTSFMGRIRARTGLVFDLPTESQWEYACRAGTTTALNSGKNLTNTSQDSAMDEVGCYYYNDSVNKGGYTSGHKNVGSYLPNAWGLYDMHGNVWEWCLDWYQSSLGTSAVTDPKGGASGSIRVLRGGSWFDFAHICRSAYRNYYSPPHYDFNFGFRLCCSAGQ